MSEWKQCINEVPENGVIVMTKIDDSKGERNVCTLKRSHHLWFFPDDSMYVYYTPTHWRQVTDDERSKVLMEFKNKIEQAQLMLNEVKFQ